MIFSKTQFCTYKVKDTFIMTKLGNFYSKIMIFSSYQMYIVQVLYIVADY